MLLCDINGLSRLEMHILTKGPEEIWTVGYPKAVHHKYLHGTQTYAKGEF